MKLRTFSTIVCALVVALVVGCGGTSEEDQLTQTEELLTGARGEVRAALAEVHSKEQGVETARVELDQARIALQEAREQLAEAEAEVDLAATDALLFRGIQRRLLEDERLARIAVRAEVDKGVVTLRGSVPDPDAREAALEIAQSFPGVAVVENELELSPVGSPGP
jgi:osmotically-inducible protein OsmY